MIDDPGLNDRWGMINPAVSIEEYRRLTDELPSFKDFLLAAPDLDALDIDRSDERAPVVELAPPVGDTP